MRMEGLLVATTSMVKMALAEQIASSKVAARAVFFSTAPAIWPSYNVQRASADQEGIGTASADRSNEIINALHRWENEGGRIRSDGTATSVLMAQD